MYASTARSTVQRPAESLAVRRFRSEGPVRSDSGPDLATAQRLGHRLEALVAPRPALPGTSVPIQRALPPDRLEHLPHDLRQDLSPQVEAFNQHLGTQPQVGQERVHRDQQFEMLHAIDQRINTHLRDNPGANEPTRTALFSLLRESEDHHKAVTSQAVQANDPLWLPHSVGANDAQQARARWTSIVGGHGNLGIEGDDDFRAETHSSVAKLLGGAHGRGMLDELDAPQQDPDKRVTLRRDVSSAAAPRTLGRYIQMGPAPNVGTGSIVKIAPRGEMPNTLDAYGSGAQGEAIFSPRFVALGHELGHARHNLTGTSGDVLWHGDEAIQDPVEKALWTDPEEHRNITQEENAIRNEHQLPTRTFHTTRGSARSTRNRMELTARLDQLMNTIPEEHAGTLGPSLGGIHQTMHGTDLSNPEHAQDLHRRIDELEREMPGRIRWEQAKAFGRSLSRWFGWS